MLISLFDSHAHLPEFTSDALTLELPSGLDFSAVTSAKISDWDLVKQSVSDKERIIPGFGIHPWFCEDISYNWEEKLIDNLESTNNSFIGECGIDVAKYAHREFHYLILKKEIEIASELKKNIVFHWVGDWGKLLQIVGKMSGESFSFMIHSFGGSAGIVSQLLPYSSFFSISANILNTSYKRLAKAVEEIPPDRLLIETDSFWYSDGKNVKILEEIIKKISEIKGVALLELSSMIYENSLRFFLG